MKLKNNLIGITGKIKSGKDTVASLINLALNTELNEQDKAMLLRTQVATGNKTPGPFEYKAFEDNLKQVVSILTGCTLSMLYDSQFKEHMCYNITTGKIKSKDDIIEEYQAAQATNVDVNEPIIYETPCDLLMSYEENSWLTFRCMLQEVGTETVRTRFPLGWINSMFTDYVEMTKGVNTDPYGGNLEETKIMTEKSQWLITDVRLNNEFEAIRERGGLIIKVDRSLGLRFPDIAKQYTSEENDGVPLNEFLYNEGYDFLLHKSETDLDKVEADIIVNNTFNTLEELYKYIKYSIVPQLIEKHEEVEKTNPTR